MKNVLFIKQLFPKIVEAAMFVIHVLTSKVGIGRVVSMQRST